jgi:chromosome segregation ATPase
MKLNDFISKPTQKIIKKPTQFVLQNEVAETKYERYIADLNTELAKYRNAEAERDKANASLQVAQRGNEELKELTSSLSVELDATKLTLEAQDRTLSKIPELNESIQNLTTELSSTKSELKTMTKTAFSQSNDISRLAKELGQTKKNNEVLEADNIQATANKISAEVEKTQVLEKNTRLQSFADETSKMNGELVEKNKELRDTFNYWEKESNEVQIQLQESIQVEAKLKKWISDLEGQTSINTSVKGELNNKVVSLETTIKDMSKLMDDLMEELKYLRTVNKEYRKELAKPRYVSMGTIAKREGFKIPFEKENIRTHNLGNSAPTLLKFKADGVTNDN